MGPSAENETMRVRKSAPRHANVRGHDTGEVTPMSDTRYSGTPRECANCGEEFLAKQEHRNFTRKYCSFRCNGEASRKRAAAKYPPKEEVLRLYEEGGLTDRELGLKYGRSHQWALSVRKFHGIPGRPAGQLRKKPLHKKRDRARWGIGMKREDRCRNCKREVERLDLHHVVPRSQSTAGKYDLRNGIPLCTTCHGGWHGHSVNIYRDVFTADEWGFIQTLTGSPWLDKRYPVRPSDGGTLNTVYCQKGHTLEGHNLAIVNGHRRCRQCDNARARDLRARRNAEAGGSE